MRVNKLTAVLVGAVALTAGLATAASAGTSTNPYVTVTHYDNGTQVNTGVPGQPLFSVGVDDRGVCGGFSYEEGFCLPVSTG